MQPPLVLRSVSCSRAMSGGFLTFMSIKIGEIWSIKGTCGILRVPLKCTPNKSQDYLWGYTLICAVLFHSFFISVPTSFSRLHLLRSIQTVPAAYWFHLSHCINPPGTKQEVISGHLDAAQSLFSSLFLLLSWPLVFPRLCRSRKLRLSEYEEGTSPSVGKHTHKTQHTFRTQEQEGVI